MHAGIFFDRDGTINEEVNYLSSPDQLRLIPRAAHALREGAEMGYKIFIISNQSGVARGWLTEAKVHEINQALLSMLQIEHASVSAVYFCPHHPDYGESDYKLDCNCRKPNPGMLTKAAQEFDIDLSRSYVIGDKISDVQAALNAGAQGILVKTGYGSEQMNLLAQNNVTTAYIAEDCYDAVQFIKRNSPQASG